MERATVTDESGRPVDLDAISGQDGNETPSDDELEGAEEAAAEAEVDAADAADQE